MATGNIPIARELLEELAERQPEEQEAVDEILRLLHRDHHGKPKAKATRKGLKKLTDDELYDILVFSMTHPKMAQRAVAAKFGVDGARVSELWGSRRNERLDRIRNRASYNLLGCKWDYENGPAV